MRDVAAVGARRRPAQRFFLGGRAGKELRGAAEDVLDGGERDGVVREVDKACGLETAQDGVGCGLPLGRRAVEEVREVHELGSLVLGNRVGWDRIGYGEQGTYGDEEVVAVHGAGLRCHLGGEGVSSYSRLILKQRTSPGQ